MNTDFDPTMPSLRPMKVNKAAVRRLLPVLALAAVAACSAGSSTTPTPSGRRTDPTSSVLTIGLVLEPASLDFTRIDGAAIPQALMSNVYETLVGQDENGKLVPGLAKSWSLSADRKTYTFELVEGAKFSNGDPFTAETAAFSINQVKTDAWKISLKRAMDVIAEVKTFSPNRLQVTLSKPSNDWLFRMSTRIGAMMDPKAVDQLATTPVGTGPYLFDSWDRGDKITLKANPAYWGGKPAYTTVHFKYIKDGSALNNALISGTINVIGTVQAPESLAQFEGNSKYQVIDGTTNGEVVLSFNDAKAPFTNLKFRQAIRTAIDHKALLDTCWAGKGTLIGTMVPPTDPWYEDRTGDFPYNQAKARQLLAESGTPTAALRLRVPNLPYAVSCGQVVKSQLEQVGLTVNLETLEFQGQWLPQVFASHDYDMSIVGHVEPRDLPAVFGNPNYYTQYNNPQLQADLTTADTGTTEDQTAGIKRAAQELSLDAGADFLFLLPNLIVADNNISGLPKNAITEGFNLAALRPN